jgi:Tfp pilus assembly protein PilE
MTFSLEELQMSDENIKELEGKKKRSCGCYFMVAIIIFIVLILAAIAIPDFLKFATKAVQSEAKQNLAAMYITQMVYHDEHGHYAGGENCFELLQWEPEGNTRYSYYCDKDKIPCNYREDKCPAPVVPEYTKDSYLMFAVGDIDNDSDCDYWSINEQKTLINDPTDLFE